MISFTTIGNDCNTLITLREKSIQENIGRVSFPTKGISKKSVRAMDDVGCCYWFYHRWPKLKLSYCVIVVMVENIRVCNGNRFNIRFEKKEYSKILNKKNLTLLPWCVSWCPCAYFADLRGTSPFLANCR